MMEIWTNEFLKMTFSETRKTSHLTLVTSILTRFSLSIPVMSHMIGMIPLTLMLSIGGLVPQSLSRNPVQVK